MGGLLQPIPLNDRSESSWRPILVGVALVVVVVGIVALLLRSSPKPAAAPNPYAANLQFSDLKMGIAENFVGATTTYLDGTVTNAGDKTVTQAMAEVIFKNDLGQLAQREDLPLRILRTTGPYPEAIALNLSPLAPGQSNSFRLTFDHVTTDWNREMPSVKATDVTIK